MNVKRWLVFNIGCIECGVSSGVVGTYETEQEANAVSGNCRTLFHWREGGQNEFEVFDLLAESNEYSEAQEPKP